MYLERHPPSSPGPQIPTINANACGRPPALMIVNFSYFLPTGTPERKVDVRQLERFAASIFEGVPQRDGLGHHDGDFYRADILDE
jgi:hypothetical protein